jgi:pimeloyl-ACP methyl ester carboxylesterase
MMSRCHISKNVLVYLVEVLCLLFMYNGCSCRQEGDKNIGNPIIKKQAEKKIFLLNGLWQNVNMFDYTIQSLSKFFKEQGMVVEICTLQENLTSKHSITHQAIDTFEAIKSQVGNNPSCPIILVGHSQGGLRAAKICVLNEQAGSPLTIKALITLGSPWQGAPVAAISKKSLKTQVAQSPFKYVLKRLSYILPRTIQPTHDVLLRAFFDYFPMDNPGVQDMVPQSPFLVSLASDMAALHDKPVLAIAGSNDNIAKFLKHTPEKAPEPFATYFRYTGKLPDAVLNKFYAHVVAGSKHLKSDLVVPVSSQLGAQLSCPFERYVVPDAVHDLIPFIDIPSNLLIYNHPDAIEQVKAFTKAHFDGP